MSNKKNEGGFKELIKTCFKTKSLASKYNKLHKELSAPHERMALLRRIVDLDDRIQSCYQSENSLGIIYNETKKSILMARLKGKQEKARKLLNGI